MGLKIESIEARDVRFPTSKDLDGSDAINKDPDYSAAYAIINTNDSSLKGYGFTFTEGRGNDLCVEAIRSLSYLLEGKTLEELTVDMAAFYRLMTSDSQLRWLGPEKGIIHMATGALVNAVWDLYAKKEGKPLWRLVADMSPEELVSCIDFKYLTDVITPEEVIEMLSKIEDTKQDRINDLLENGYPAYNTSAGWLGYSEDKIRRLSREAKAAGWTHLKMKVGSNLEEDVKRAEIIREEIGDDMVLMMDANQNWDVNEAIENMKYLAAFNPW